MALGVHNLVRIFEVPDHALPLFFTMSGNHYLLFLLGAQVHAHTNGIGFGVKLGTHHPWIKADSHNSPL